MTRKCKREATGKMSYSTLLPPFPDGILHTCTGSHLSAAPDILIEQKQLQPAQPCKQHRRKPLPAL